MKNDCKLTLRCIQVIFQTWQDTMTFKKTVLLYDKACQHFCIYMCPVHVKSNSDCLQNNDYYPRLLNTMRGLQQIWCCTYQKYKLVQVIEGCKVLWKFHYLYTPKIRIRFFLLSNYATHFLSLKKTRTNQTLTIFEQ